MGTSLSGLTPATTFDGLLKVGDNDPLTADLKAISTGDGTDTILSLSDSALSIGGNAEIDSSGLNALVIKRNGTELLKTDGSGLNGGLTFTGNLTNKFSLGVNGNDFNIWDGSYLGGGDLRFSILADGKTAIGAQTPTAKLHIKGSGTDNTTTSLLVQNSAGTDIFKVVDDNTMFYHTHKFRSAGGYLYIEGEGNVDRYLRVGQNFTASSYDGHIFKTYDGTAYSEAMRITGNTDQFVGIGETTPTARLHVKSSGNSSGSYALKVDNFDSTAYLNFRDDGLLQLKASSTSSSKSALQLLDLNGSTLFRVFANKTGYITGNFGVGTDTSTARLHIKGEAPSGDPLNNPTALLVENSAGTDLLKVTDDGVVTTSSTINAGVFAVLASGSALASTYAKVNNTFLKAGGQGINISASNTNPDASAQLQVDSTTQGFLPPRMTTEQKNAITSPAAGLMVYDTDQNQMNYWNSSGWIAF